MKLLNALVIGFVAAAASPAIAGLRTCFIQHSQPISHEYYPNISLKKCVIKAHRLALQDPMGAFGRFTVYDEGITDFEIDCLGPLCETIDSNLNRRKWDFRDRN